MAAPTFSSCHSLTFSVQLKIGQTSRRLVRPKMTKLILGTGNSETLEWKIYFILPKALLIAKCRLILGTVQYIG